MKLSELQEMLRSYGSEYATMQAELLLPRIAPADGIAFDALGALAQEEGTAAVVEVLELAEKVTPRAPIGFAHVRAAIRHRYDGTDKGTGTLRQLGRMPWPDMVQDRI
ncbi:hypothetical protein [uncultured Methylobacterium sp.]|uniref:hypothetical protein n=1 Tax=uncultured Methylobacterium sp. TaxID=157278 RepID=UPI0035C94C8F